MSVSKFTGLEIKSYLYLFPLFGDVAAMPRQRGLLYKLEVYDTCSLGDKMVQDSGFIIGEKNLARLEPVVFGFDKQRKGFTDTQVGSNKSLISSEQFS